MSIEAALARFDLPSLRKEQRPVVEAALAGRDLLSVLPTGSGKSLCYQLPALCDLGVTIVISPLLALMRDQMGKLQSQNIPCFHVSSAQSEDENHANFAALQRARSGLFYLSPEQLSKGAVRNFLLKLPLARLVVDEAHCFSSWGHDFRPDYRAIPDFLRIHPLPLSAFTATASQDVLADLRGVLFGGRAPLEFLHSPKRDNIELQFCLKDKPRQQLLSLLRDDPDHSTIIYAATRNKTQVLAQALREKGRSAAHYHAGLEADKRVALEAAFLAGQTQIMVATNAFGMGVDHPSIRQVIHADMPASVEAYVQEIGRAGRDGKNARAVCLYSEDDHTLCLEKIETSIADPAHRNHQIACLDMFYTLLQEGGGWDDIEAYFNHATPDRMIYPRGANDPQSALKRWRYHEAQRRKIPPYFVLPDRLLERIAQSDPQNIDALAQIEGVGGKRLEKYGEALLQALGARGEATGRARRALALRGDGALFDALQNTARDLRLGEDGCQKPLECSAPLLRRIVQSKPQTQSALTHIQGMNAARLERFGAAFLLVLEEFSG